MKNLTRCFLFALIIVALLSATLVQSSAHDYKSNTASPNRLTQYDDPYSDFRNAKYSNVGLLNERDEIKLGTQLHREVTKKFNLTDTGLARADGLGQCCAQAILRP